MQVEDMVESMLKSFSETRNSSTILYCKLLNQFRHAGFTNEQIEIMLSIPFETVARISRKFREKGKYLGTEEVQDERMDRCRQMTERFGNGRKYLEAVLAKNKQKVEEENKNSLFPRS